MSGRRWIAFLAFGLTYLAAASFASSPLTEREALALGKKLCGQYVPSALTPVHWTSYSADAGSNRKNKNGDYWLVDGQYYPRTPPRVLSVIDMLAWVPENGTQPNPCTVVSN